MRVDVRGLPVWERPAAVFEAFDRLTNGEILTIVTENEPRGLAASLQQARQEIMLERRRVGAAEWHVSIRRTEGSHAPSAENILRRTPLFCDLPEQAISALANAATIHTARRGQTIVHEDIDWPYIGIVFEGALALSSGEKSARQRIYYEIPAGETFGETEFFDAGLTVGRTIALTKTARYLRVPRDVVHSAGMQFPQVIISLAHVAAQRTRFLAEALTAQATQPILARIASVLLPYATTQKGLAPAHAPLPSMTQAQIAAAAGTVKEVAARAIAELETRELLKRERGHIRFLDRQGLIDLVREPS